MSLLRSLSGRLAASTLLALTATSLALAQTPVTVFEDTFGAGSTVNNSTTPASPSLNAAAYQIVSGKTYLATPTVAPGALSFGLGSASTNTYIEAQANFARYAVKLDALTDYIEMTVVFTAETSLLDDANSAILFGLFNSSSIAPVPTNPVDPVVSQPYPGGRQETTTLAGYAGNWRGHLIRIFGSGGAYRLYGRTAATSGFNQEVLGTGGSQFASTPGSTFSALSATQKYTAVIRFTKINSLATPRIQGEAALYAGSTASGTALGNGIVQSNATSSGNILTMVYDSLAIGFKTSTSAIGNKSMAINSIKVVTTGKTVIVPVITTQPVGQSVIVGDPVTLTVAATGGGDPSSALSYQWRKDGFDIAGATSNSIVIPTTVFGDAGTYSVVVTNTRTNADSSTTVVGTTTSSNAIVAVNPPLPPSINVHPADVSAVSGGPATFTVTATGSGLTYQWQKSTNGGTSFSDIAGATSASYTIPRTQTSSIGLYRVVVTNSTAAVTSNNAALTLTYNFTSITPSGYASSATGGGNAVSVNVGNLADFKAQAESGGAAVITVQGIINLNGKVSVKSDKTIQGIDGEATIIGNLELASGVSNVVLRGFNITNPSGSGVTIAGASNVFVSQISFYDCSDTMLAITNGADNITVSWSEFYYSALATGNKATVVGSSTEAKPIRVTFDHCWWSDNTSSAMPDITYGNVHIYNSLFKPTGSTAMGNDSGTLVHTNAQLFSERNQYTQIASPITKEASTIGLIRTLGNVYTSTTGTAAYGGADFINFAPPYSYQLSPTSSVTADVSASAGNTAGASTPTPVQIGTASITSTATAVPLGGSFTLTAVTDGLNVAATTPFQWRINGQALTTATTNTITVGGATASNAGSYTVAVLLATGETIVSTPFSVTITSGSSAVPASQSEAAGGGGAPSFWFMGALAFLAGLRRFFRRN